MTSKRSAQAFFKNWKEQTKATMESMRKNGTDGVADMTPWEFREWQKKNKR